MLTIRVPSFMITIIIETIIFQYSFPNVTSIHQDFDKSSVKRF